MITLFSKEKRVAAPEALYEIEKTANAQDEISRILREYQPEAWQTASNPHMNIFQRQF